MLSGTERQAAGSIYGAMSYDIENKPTAFDTHRAIGHRRKPHRSQQTALDITQLPRPPFAATRSIAALTPVWRKTRPRKQ
jgi:hypothetical protein